MATSTPPLPETVYGVFSDQINLATTYRIFQNIAGASQKGVAHVHLLFQSNGGFVADGICLYNAFRALPLGLTLYNAGSVQSIGAIAYLGAKCRKASTYSSFMIHRTTFSPQFATGAQLKSLVEAAGIDDARVEAILRNHLKLPDDLWKELYHRDLVFSAQDAVKYGLADEVAEFTPPTGATIYNI